MKSITLFPTLQKTVADWTGQPIDENRKADLQVLIDYIQSKVDQQKTAQLNFICTHNSRRSHLTQLWAKVAADYHQVPADTYSGGVEVTAFNERAVASLQRAGFKVEAEGDENPRYSMSYAEEAAPQVAFSKLFDDAVNPSAEYASIMTCSHADENCPVLFGAEARIPLRYEDPKAFDGTAEEGQKYDERSAQIANELFYAFSKIKK
ncbi:protein-tyrosine-phosphatase [Persicobacter psychrovividus]|uniref:Arsenate reductase n=1 Tax=Persicobacter psychrovividus TaxID=387638 RepID=A0ABM7VAH4_9BACT|nr:arsenate reductase [Persicobacter psychrovividus]